MMLATLWSGPFPLNVLQAMNRYSKHGLAVFAGGVVFLVALAMLASQVIRPNDYKQQIIQLVKDKKQRTLVFASDIKLAYFPKLGVDLGRISVSEFRGEREFAAVESARLYLSWWSLLKGELVVDRMRIEGAHVNLVRFQDGTTNFDDLLKKDEEDQRVKFDPDSVSIGKSALSFRDEAGGWRIALEDVEIRTSRPAKSAPAETVANFRLRGERPNIDAKIHFATLLALDAEAGRHALKGMVLEVMGGVAGIDDFGLGLKGDVALDRTDGMVRAENIALAVAGRKGTDDIDVRLLAPKLNWSADRIETGRIDVVAKVQRVDGEAGLVAGLDAISGDSQGFKAGMLKMDLRARINQGEYIGKLSSPVSGDFKEKRLALGDLKGDLVASAAGMAKGGLKLEAAGVAQFDLKHRDATLNLSARLDESNIKLTAAASLFPAPRVTLDMDIDQLDADRYWPASAEDKQPRAGKPLDFPALKTRYASGSIRIGSLTFNHLKARDLRLVFKGDNGESLPAVSR